jgi:hypothetical protein
LQLACKNSRSKLKVAQLGAHVPAMKLIMKDSTKLVLEKSPAAGGSGGSRFDSGCNTSGVTKIRIECGCIDFEAFFAESTINRVFLEFLKPTDSDDIHVPSYHGYEIENPRGRNQTFTFALDPGDEIVKAVVWTDGIIANAVEFHTQMGNVSPIYGIPKDGSKAVEFQGGPGSKLVGIYGRFGQVIDSLGFTFASLVPVPGEAISEAIIDGLASLVPVPEEAISEAIDGFASLVLVPEEAISEAFDGWVFGSDDSTSIVTSEVE